MSLQSQLAEMGFPENKIAWALKQTKNAGLEQAVNFLFENADKEPPTQDEQDEEDAEIKGVGEGEEAKSIKCMECGKIFKNTALASYHGEKSGHDQFEESTDEIKPLTAEEKEAKLADLRARMAEKKRENLKREQEEQKQNEIIKRKAGKDQAKIKAELELKEAEKAAIQRKADKIADAKAKDAVRRQIEADKQARKDKAEREKALREGKTVELVAPTTTSAPGLSTTTAAKKDYAETRLQIRLPSGGQPLVTTRRADEKLSALKAWIRDQEAGATWTGGLSSAFPRKTYGAADDGKTLAELGLTPSAVLMLS
ncbi:hypothetical protein T439DRAFT_85096 [Meredithblackwellia eburnea MCA 4105]